MSDADVAEILKLPAEERMRLIFVGGTELAGVYFHQWVRLILRN